MKYILRRIFAFLVDYLVISIISVPLGIALSISTPFLRAGGYLLFAGLIILATLLLIGYIYHLYFWSSYGQSPGKMITNLRVIDKEGRNPGLIGSTKRYIGYLIGILTLGVAFLYVVFQKEGKGLHDLLAGTKVVENER